MKELFLLRGLPGSGKSTLAKSLSDSHIEADMFFMKDGEYKFDGSKIKMPIIGVRMLWNIGWMKTNRRLWCPIPLLKNGKWTTTPSWLKDLGIECFH